MECILECVKVYKLDLVIADVKLISMVLHGTGLDDGQSLYCGGDGGLGPVHKGVVDLNPSVGETSSDHKDPK